jgi:hypothetical protein
MSTLADTLAAFEHTALSEVDPTFKPVDQDVYTLEIVSAGPQDYKVKATSAAVVKGTAVAGDDARMYKWKFLIVDSDKYSGRSLFPAYFPSDFTAKAFRRVMDATGVPQEPGESLSDWMKRFETFMPRARFKTLVKLKAGRSVDAAGNPVMENEVPLLEVQPA